MELSGDSASAPDFVHEMCRGLTFFDLISKSKLPVSARVGLDLILSSPA